MLAPHNSFNNVINFSVGKYLPLLSDHCPISTTINTIFPKENTNDEICLTELDQKIIWDGKVDKKFQEGIQSPASAKKISRIGNKQ